MISVKVTNYVHWFKDWFMSLAGFPRLKKYLINICVTLEESKSDEEKYLFDKLNKI